MNKITHTIIFIGLLILIISLYKIIEPFEDYTDSNIIPVIDFNKQNYLYESPCNDDLNWKRGDKTCRDYSIFGYDCKDIGYDGRTAEEACKVSCDNCSTYQNIEFKEKEKILDSRHIFNKLYEIENKIKNLFYGDSSSINSSLQDIIIEVTEGEDLETLLSDTSINCSTEQCFNDKINKLDNIINTLFETSMNTPHSKCPEDTCSYRQSRMNYIIGYSQEEDLELESSCDEIKDYIIESLESIDPNAFQSSDDESITYEDKKNLIFVLDNSSDMITNDDNTSSPGIRFKFCCPTEENCLL